MDYNKAFGFVFEDKEWLSKAVIGALLTLVGIFIIPAFIVTGYYFEVTQRVMRGEDGLPEWDEMGKKLSKGFSLFVVELVYAIPALILFLIAGAFWIVTGVAANGSGSDAATAAGVVVGIVFLSLAYLYVLIFAYVLLPTVTVRFAQTESIGETLKIGEVLSIVKNNFGQVLMLALFVLVAGFISQIGIIALIIGVFFTTFYAQAMLHHLYGQFGKMLVEAGERIKD